MVLSRKQVAIIHVAKKKTGLTDDAYRSVLARVAEVTSSTELNQEGFEALMGYFEFIGFTPMKTQGPTYGERAGMASAGQVTLVRTLWDEYTKGKSCEASLNKWLENKWKISSLRFLSRAKAPQLITALKAMKARAA